MPKEFEVDSAIPLIKICTLNDSVSVLGEVSSFCMIDESSFVVSSSKSAKVVVFSTSGEYQLDIGSKGNGPLEYLSPSLVEYKNQKFYVWCNMKNKLIIYDKNGLPIKEYTNYKKAINDFTVFDNYVFFNPSGGLDDQIVQIYDLNISELIGKSYGVQTNEHKILNAFSGAGGLALSEGELLLSPNDELLIHRVDLEDFSYSTYKINDDDFNVEKVNIDHVKFMADPTSVQYIFGSDVVTEILYTNNCIILICEVGKIELNGFQIVDNSKRRPKYYVFDKNLNLKYSIRTKIDPGGNGLYSTLDGNIYKIRYNIDLGYELCLVDLSGYN